MLGSTLNWSILAANWCGLKAARPYEKGARDPEAQAFIQTYKNPKSGFKTQTQDLKNLQKPVLKILIVPKNSLVS